jgi:hypothetical protein
MDWCRRGASPNGLSSLAADANSRPICGRYTHKLTWAEIVKLYQLTLPDQEPAGFKPSYNVALTDVMWICLEQTSVEGVVAGTAL